MNLFKRLTTGLFLGANICTILLLWLCVALTYISPEHLPRISLLTLAFPIFLTVNILFIPFWLIFKARLAWIPIAGILIVASHCLDYCPINLNTNRSSNNNDSTITIITFNIGCKHTGKESRDKLLQYINEQNPDIVCLQEVPPHFLENHQKWLDSTAYHHLQSYTNSIITKFPIISDTIHISYPTRSNHSIACWIDCYGDSLLIINNHLESNHLDPDEKNEYTNAITDPESTKIKKSSRILINKLSEATTYRGAQADTLHAIVQQNTNHETILCGDLNETPISYTYQRIARNLTSAYREAGTGPGFTFSSRAFPVRIDHLFHSKGWTCTSCSIDRSISTSDHYPLIVRLRKNIR
jgi:endonuclease/exonuclease/phosphatase family metal-dependent hydrolase